MRKLNQVDHGFEHNFSDIRIRDFSAVTQGIKNQIIPLKEQCIGYYAPWQETHEKVLFRPGELCVWTGINGHGKSQFLGHIILGMLEQGAKVCLANSELSPAVFGSRLHLQAAAESNPSIEYIKAVNEWFSGKLWYIDSLRRNDIDTLLLNIEVALRRHGINVFVIDSFMHLEGISEEEFDSQKYCMQQLCVFKKQHNCQIHIITHPNKYEDEAKVPGRLDIRGSGIIADLADSCFSIWRNKEKEEIREIFKNKLPLTSNQKEILDLPDTLWSCDKQRQGKWEGTFGLWYEPNSGQFLSNKHDEPKPYGKLLCLKEEKIKVS